MSNFYVRGILANLITLAILLACLFIPAGTLNYWQAWVFVAVFGVSAQALGIYFLVHDRKLVAPYEHRTRGGTATGAEIHLGAFHPWVCRVRGASCVRPSLRLVSGCAGRVSDRERNDSTILLVVLHGDEIEPLCRFDHTGRGGTARRVDGPICLRPASDVFGCIASARGDATRARFVVERFPPRAVLPGTRLAHP